MKERECVTVLRARQIRQTDFLLYNIALYFVLLFGRYSLQLNNKNPYYYMLKLFTVRHMQPLRVFVETIWSEKDREAFYPS